MQPRLTLVLQANQSRWSQAHEAAPAFRSDRISSATSGTLSASTANAALRHSAGSIESALLLKIREAKRIRTGGTPSSTARSFSPRRVPISPSHAMLRSRTPVVHGVRKPDASKSALSIDSTPQALGQQLSLPRFEVLDAPDARQTPLEPPVPHRKPEKPQGTTVPVSISTLRGDSKRCSAHVAGAVEDTIQIHLVVAATKAARLIQRVWRQRRSIRVAPPMEHAARSSCTPVCTIVVHQEADSTIRATLETPETTKTMQDHDAAKPTSGLLRVETNDEEEPGQMPEIHIAPSELTTTSQVPLWSEDEWSFLEEGRSVRSALLDGKSEGARMSGDELVWKFPQSVIAQREAQRLRTAQQAKTARKIANVRKNRPRSPAALPEPTDSVSVDQVSHPMLVPKRRRKDQRVFRLCRHLKVSQRVYKKWKATSKQVLVNHWRPRTSPLTTASACTPGASPLIIETPAPAAPTNKPSDDAKCSIVLATSSVSGLREPEGPEQRKESDLNATSTAALSPTDQFVEFGSLSSVSCADRAVQGISPHGFRNDLICMGDLMVAGHLLLDATRTFQERCPQPVDPTTKSATSEAQASDMITLPLAAPPIDVATERDCRANSDDERALGQGEATKPARHSDARNSWGELGGETGRQSHGSLKDEPAIPVTDVTALADDIDTLASGGDGEEFAPTYPMHSLQELENTIVQTLSRIHSYVPPSTADKSDASSSLSEEEHLSERRLLRDDTSDADLVEPSVDPREQHEFHQILSDFRQYLRLSSVDSSYSRSSGYSDSQVEESDEAFEASDTRYDADDADAELCSMASEIRQCRARVAQSLTRRG